MATNRIHLTLPRISAIKPQDGKQAVYHFDDDPKQLAVRVTPAGAKSFVYCGKLGKTPFRITIGDVDTWNLDEARAEARRLQTITDQGRDPRQVRRELTAADEQSRSAIASKKAQKEEESRRRQITLGEAWGDYIANPPKRKGKTWGERHLSDHKKVMLPVRTKEQGKKARTLTAGLLASLAPLPLSALTPERISAWLEEETPRRPTQAALAFRLLRAFINWCNEREPYKGIAASDACASKISREHLPKASPKQDSLQREQLRLWFESVQKIPNRTISAYLQGLLITGARRNELASLRWDEVDFQWNSLTIRDKVEGERTIPLTPYLANLLRDLKAQNEAKPTVRRLNTLKAKGKEWKPSPWVFSSPTSEDGRLQEPSIAHRKAIAAVGLPPVSLHGLRRSFGSLAEWVECPAGVVAQIQGHKPSATAEKHYRVRPLDLLRMWHTKIEAWILEQAGIESVRLKENGKLKAVK